MAENKKNMTNENGEDGIIVLTNDLGEDVEFFFLDCIELRGEEYIVLIENSDEADQVVILKIESVDDEHENYVGIDDEDLLMEVFDLFKERNKDTFGFEE